MGVYVLLLKFRLLETLRSKLRSWPDPFEFCLVCLCNLGVCGDWVLAFTQVLLVQHVLPVSPSIQSVLQCSVCHLHTPLLWNVEVIHYLPDYPSPCFCASLPKPRQINVEPCPANKSTHTLEPRVCFIWFSWSPRLEINLGYFIYTFRLVCGLPWSVPSCPDRKGNCCSSIPFKTT